MRYLAIAFGVMLSGIAASDASALCLYRGELYAKTTIAQEFEDSQWVFRASVVGATSNFSDDDIPDDDEPWTVYELEVVQAFKGEPPSLLRFFTLRNSGGFYMDRPWEPLPEGHDIGGEYLLFVNPIDATSGLPAAARGAVFVNYSCGVSGRWSEVSDASRRELVRLSR